MADLQVDIPSWGDAFGVYEEDGPAGMMALAQFFDAPAEPPRSPVGRELIDTQQAQQEEMAVLESIYGPDYERIAERLFRITVRPPELTPRAYRGFGHAPIPPTLRVTVCFSDSYPQTLPIFEIASENIAYHDEDVLYDDLMVAASQRLGAAMLFDLVNLARERLEDLARKAWDAPARVECDPVFSGKPRHTLVDADGGTVLPFTATADAVAPPAEEPKDDLEMIYDPPPTQRRVPHPSMYIGSLVELFRSLPPGIAVTSIENVLRPDLAQRFDAMRNKLVQCYGPEFGEITTGFHGTDYMAIGSIVRTGLVVPGTKGVEVRHGSALGVGVYLSVDPQFSMNYVSGSGRLLICAALMGQHAAKMSSYPRAPKMAHTVFAPPQMCLFDAAQVLPCYVLHVDTSGCSGEVLTVTRAGTFIKVAQTFHNHRYGHREEEERRQEEMRALAREASIKNAKFFVGDRYEVLDVAEHDDDDDDFQYYARVRGVDADSARVWTAHDAAVEAEFQTERFEPAVVEQEKPQYAKKGKNKR